MAVIRSRCFATYVYTSCMRGASWISSRHRSYVDTCLFRGGEGAGGMISVFFKSPVAFSDEHEFVLLREADYFPYR